VFVVEFSRIGLVFKHSFDHREMLLYVQCNNNGCNFYILRRHLYSVPVTVLENRGIDGHRPIAERFSGPETYAVPGNTLA
jgi:hypothetical protein